MGNYDWSKFTKRIDVKTSIEAAYRLWTTEAGLERWFLRFAEFTTPDDSLRPPDSHVQEGDTYRWFWFGWDDNAVEAGKVLKVNGKDFFQFTFAKNCTVSVTIKTEEGQTIVELVQENIPTDEESKVNWHVGCSTGWTFYLANLKSILEGGVDLRNKNLSLKHMANS